MTGVLSLGVWGGVAGRRAGLTGWPLVLSIAYSLVLGELETPAMVSTIKMASGGTATSRNRLLQSGDPTAATLEHRRVLICRNWLS